MTTVIYALFDRRTPMVDGRLPITAIRYVGQTNRLNQDLRLSEHLNEHWSVNPNKHFWFEQIGKENVAMFVFDSLRPPSRATNVLETLAEALTDPEKLWIEHVTAQGAQLTNIKKTNV